MILSHKYKFIFIKTNKTAGTSIEIALSKYCGDEDIITPIRHEDENIRRRLGYRGPQNCRTPFHKLRLRDWAKYFFAGGKKQFYNHMSALEIKRMISEELWNGCFKFCFERNPWDRVVSRYYWILRRNPGLTLSDFIDQGGAKIIKDRGWGLYTIGGEIAVDKVGSYEDLHQELEEIAGLVGLPEKPVLPHAKAGYRKDRRHYRDLFTDEQKELIADMFAEEIERFGYEY